VHAGSVFSQLVIGGTLNTAGAITLTDAATLHVRFGNLYGNTGLHATGNVLLEPAGTPGPQSGPGLEVVADPSFALARLGQSFPIVSVDAGFTLTGQFQGMPEGFLIVDPLSPHSGFTIHYNVDGGDGSANDVVLRAVPEPGAMGLVVMSLVGTLLRRRRR
jgi:hypothetical protein